MTKEAFYKANPSESKDEDLEKQLERIKLHLTKIGYPGGTLGSIIFQLQLVAKKYENPGLAGKFLADGFSKYVKGPFGDKQFKTFLREIDPGFIGNSQIEKELGVLPSEIHILNEEEKKEYLLELKNLKDTTLQHKKGHLEVLSNQEIYDILTSVAWKKMQEGYPLPDELRVKPKIINTPMGGMPGYKIKRKRR